jgi:uncharacterized protein (DUF488 family)
MAQGQQNVIWSIGHSAHPMEEFMAILSSFQIERLVDIRMYPGSRRHPHFNKQGLEVSLPEANIKYCHLADLGGRRQPKANSKNTGWRLKAFRGYADHMETDAFQNGIKQLEDLARCERTVYMCSEAVWWSCHRALISDYLKVRGWSVMHIMGHGKAKEHPFTGPAKNISGTLSYEA